MGAPLVRSLLSGIALEVQVGRNRLLALAAVAAFLGLLRQIAPEPAQRAVWLYLVALPLGYGHILGAASFSHALRRGSDGKPGVLLLRAAFLAASLLSLFAAYAWALRSTALQPWVLAPVLLLFGWHVAENDLALGRGYREGLRLAPVARGLRPHGFALLVSSGVALATFSTREGQVFSRVYFGASLVAAQPWLTLDEITAAFLLYHTISWLIFFEDRVRALRRRSDVQAARLRRQVLAFHLVPCAVNAALYLWLPAVHSFAALPAFYLFWSAVHAVDTAWVRGLAARAPA
jgi:hypothetical protein